MKFYIITARISGADEDSLFVIQAPDDASARAEAERLAWGEVLDEDEERNEDDEFFLNTVVVCDTKPEVLHNQNDYFWVPEWPCEAK